MRAVGLLVVLACACVNAGCYVVSLQGLADDSSTVALDQIVGRWHSADDEVELTIAPDQWRTYSVVMRDGSGEQTFTGRITDVARSKLFDLTVSLGQESRVALLPVHIIGRLTVKEDTLVVELLVYDWFRGRLGRGSLTLPAVMDERDAVLLTAGRAKLRGWLAANAASPALFEEALVLARKPEGAR